MGLVSILTRQVARAAGASLIAPLALLLAAALVASGGGVGGIGALGQIASGPPLPNIGLSAAPASALDGAEIVGANVSEPAGSVTPSRSTGRLASAAPAGLPSNANRDALSPGRTSPRPPVETIRLPVPPTVEVDDGEPVARMPTPPPPAAANPVDDLLEATRGVGESLPGPLGPITSDILNLLLGPPR